MVDHYRQLLADETAYLKKHIEKYTLILEGLAASDTMNASTALVPSSEDLEAAIGQINLAIGQSNLFINERFKQFAKLIDDCELKRTEKEIKVDDLAGFWDMIYYQVADLKAKYDQLAVLEANNWVPLQSNATSEANTETEAKTKPSKSRPTKSSAAIVSKPGRSNFRDFLKNLKANKADSDY